MPATHDITAIVEGQQISGFISGNIESSMITPADKFVLRMPLTELAWRTCRRGARITIQADKTTLLDGYIDKRHAQGKADVFEFEGRDRVGRLMDESAPAIDYTGMTILDAVKRLASPWFDNVTVDDGRNRRIRRGKGRRVASGSEPVVTFNVKVPRRGNVHPGESRWQLIHEIVSRAQLVCYSSSDGKELFVGKPNQSQAPQYLFALVEPDSTLQLQNTVNDINIVEDDGDRFSMYLVAGTGGQGDTNYGRNVTDNRGVAFDNPFNKLDGTGRDFPHPKRLFLPERAFENYADAQNVAKLEQLRRDYHRHLVSVEAPTFGQDLGTTQPTLFAPDTIARVVLDKLDIDDKYLVVSCSYSFVRDNADTTVLHMVPVGTEIIL